MRTVIADDSALVRAGLAHLLDHLGHEVVGETARATALPALVQAMSAELVIVDIRMPPHRGSDGLRAAEFIRKQHPGISILVLSQYLDVSYAVWLIEQSPHGTGYLLKETILEPETLGRCIDTLAEGGTVIDPALVKQMLTSAGPRRLGCLTGREEQVLTLMAAGRSDRGIADQLDLSLNTVATHVGHIFNKLELAQGTSENRRVLAVLRWLTDGAHSPPVAAQRTITDISDVPRATARHRKSYEMLHHEPGANDDQ